MSKAQFAEATNNQEKWTIMKKNLSFVIFVLSMSLVGCGNSPIQIEKADPEKAIIDSETLDIRNCDSNDDMVTTMAIYAPVRMQISISEPAKLIKTGSVVDIPSDMLEDIKLQVGTLYQPILEEAESSVGNIELTIPRNKIHMYQIKWVQQNYNSTVSFSINGWPCTANYLYTLEIPELDSFIEMSCTA
jgi:hypothetical protein